MEQFKIRASAAYEIMADGKKKGEPSVKLFDVAENYLKEKIYGYKKTFSSKYTDKGLLMEDEAIDKAIEWLDIPFVLKNTERKETEFFTGEPDLILDDYIIDIVIAANYVNKTYPHDVNEIIKKKYIGKKIEFER